MIQGYCGAVFETDQNFANALKKLIQSLIAIFLTAWLCAICGCSTVSPSTSTDTAAASTDGPSPIDAWNSYLQLLAEGDQAAILKRIYVHPGENEKQRVEGSISVLSATAQFRKACDDAYGVGKLAALGFHCFLPGCELPKNATFKIEGDYATVFAPGQDPLKLIRNEGIWKEDFLPWEELVRLRSETREPQRLSLDRLLTNLATVSEILKQSAAEVKAGHYSSAADSFGVLNARLHGEALARSPLVIAYLVDLNTAFAKEQSNAIPIIELRGAPAALGQSQGSQLGGTIQALYHSYFDRAFGLPGKAGLRLYKRVLGVAARFERFIRPEHKQEIYALAATTGLKPAEVLLGQCFPDLNPGSACSTISLPASASLDGIARFGRNLDYETFGVLEQHSVLLIFHPQGRCAFASVAAPGFTGVLSGMNEYGLTLAVMEVPRMFRKPQAMPFMLLYRYVLENCKTVNEAIALLEKTPRQSANNLMLMDAAGDRAVAEITPDKLTVRRAPSSAPLVSTNHQRGGDLDSPNRCVRFDFLHDSSQRQFGGFSEKSVEDLLAGAAQADATFQSMVFEPANRVIYLATGANAPSHPFTRINLSPYFSEPKLSGQPR
jgi:hypothetical protein